MRKAIQFGAALLLVAAFVAVPAQAFGQETAEQLRKTVEDLVKRLDEVQKKLDAIEKKQAEQPAAAPVAPAPATPATAPKPKGLLDVYWKEGIHLDSADAEDGVKPFQLKISGRIQFHSGWMIEDHDLGTVAKSADGVEFRRSRIAVGGQIYRDYDFLAEYDFAGGKTAFKDVYISANNIPYIGTLRVGHYKEFTGIEELESDNDIIFIERALLNVFSPDRNVGASIQNNYLDQRISSQLGVFIDTDDTSANGGGDGNFAVTGRVTGLPYYYAVKNERVDKLQLVHIGAWGSYRETNYSSYEIAARPEVHLAPKYIDTFQQIGGVNSQGLFGAEAGVIYGPFSAQAEYTFDEINRTSGPEVFMQGAYVEATYILTGEHRTYKNQNGTFDKVIPKKNFLISKNGGPGAWELALRYSNLDLNDKDVHGGMEHDVSGGVNWYLNPNMRISLNYIHGWLNRDTPVTINAGQATQKIFPAINGKFDGILALFQVTW